MLNQGHGFFNGLNDGRRFLIVFYEIEQIIPLSASCSSPSFRHPPPIASSSFSQSLASRYFRIPASPRAL